jgi:hypothetical protein
MPEQAALSTFSAERAFKDLAVIGRAPHPINSAEHDVVRDYIMRALKGIGHTPQVQRTTYTDEDSETQGALENILCRIPGRTREKALLLVAHYDSVPAGPGASDDGVAVVALLEGARALKSFPQLRRDVIILLTDGEERGLLGARAFVKEHPWAQDVGVVLNFEARGTSGPSIMFETSNENGWLIGNFGHAASHPVANSLSYEIYKRLPNSTDFTIFRRAGYSGLNFAFIDGLSNYHTSRDSLQNVDMGSLQHHGDYILELTRQFGDAPSDDPKHANAVYFDVLGRELVRYSQPAAIFLLGFTGVLVGIMAYLGFKNRYLRTGVSLLGLVSMIPGVAATVVGAGAASWLTFALQKQFPAIHMGLLYHGGLYILTFSAVGLACAACFYSFALKWINSDNLMFGSLLGWLVFAIFVSIYFPGGSYLLVWPLFFNLLGWIAVFARRQTSANARIALVAFSGLPAIVLVVPMIHKIFFAFASHSAVLVSALLGLLFALMVGPIISENGSRRWLLPLLLAVMGAGFFIAAVSVSAVG